MGGMRENEDWTLRVDPAVYSPWLGDSYANFARTGLSFQRSQNGGRNDPQPGPAYGYYKRLAPQAARRREGDERLRRHRHDPHRPVRGAEASGAGERAGAPRRDPARGGRRRPGVHDGESVGHGAGAGARSGRDARRGRRSSPPIPMPSQMLQRKEQQFADAINTALGIDFTAVAQPAGVVEPTGPGAAFAPPPTMEPVVPGQSFDVKLRFTNRGSVDVEVTQDLGDPGRGRRGRRGNRRANRRRY